MSDHHDSQMCCMCFQSSTFVTRLWNLKIKHISKVLVIFSITYIIDNNFWSDFKLDRLVQPKCTRALRSERFPTFCCFALLEVPFWDNFQTSLQKIPQNDWNLEGIEPFANLSLTQWLYWKHVLSYRLTCSWFFLRKYFCNKNDLATSLSYSLYITWCAYSDVSGILMMSACMSFCTERQCALFSQQLSNISQCQKNGPKWLAHSIRGITAALACCRKRRGNKKLMKANH